MNLKNTIIKEEIFEIYFVLLLRFFRATEPEEEAEEEADDKDTFDVESFLHGVYQTAEQGVALLSSLLDIPRNGTNPTTTTPKPEETRRGKNLKHPNQL